MINSRKSTSRKGRKDSGVSEIIGDILILGITVTLFSTIFLYVNAFPTPNAQTYADFNATLSNTTSPTYLNITHEGGQALTSSLTAVVVQVNQNTSVFSLDEGYGQNFSHWNSVRWTIDILWGVNLTGSLAVTSTSVVMVSIIDKANNYLVWSSVLQGKPSHVRPVIQSAWALPNPVSPGSNITVYASIYGSNHAITVTANVSLLNDSSKAKWMPMLTAGSSGGLYNTTSFRVNATMVQVGSSYPVTVTVNDTVGNSHTSSNYTFMVSVENTGPNIVTASINPNPTTPTTMGGKFSITAYVVDNNQLAFDPLNNGKGVGSITVRALSPSLTNISVSGSPKPMNTTDYPGIYTLSGKVNSSASGVEPFLITATDSSGNKAYFTVELVVLQSLNSSSLLNQSYPSKYLGDTSMSFSQFSWRNMSTGANPSYNSGYSIPTSDVIYSSTPHKSSAGVYFNLVLENHNWSGSVTTSHDIYLDGFSQIAFVFFSFSTPNKFYADMSFIVMNESAGATEWFVNSSGTPGYHQTTVSQSSATYPALGSPSSYNPSNYILLPAAIGGVAVSVNVSFGISESSLGTKPSIPPPTSTGGPFITGAFGSGSSGVGTPAVSADFLILFGYQWPAETPPTTLTTTGIPYGQSLPFTGIYWY
ncbi:MAG: type IV pilin [Thermoplasmata archaeon]|jgi:FlaG/FlaF family flagellin (archaellin)|nr:type IV pilin [Candidatus Sysuiplasma jiujiangense]MBX8639336.1 type IV pilin [Candidatus Sysuiplasma jiujiangense]MBX8641305.1 type IV pilin [Candidatus Sysuiplasma jiujiangense]